MIHTPRKKIDHTEEQRITLGEYERQLAQYALTMNGIRSASIAASGVAQGLGIFGAIGIGALLWGKDIEDLFEQMVGIWPESGAFFSPEWIAKWGDDPTEILGESLITPDNDTVNGLAPVVNPSGSHSLEGLDPYTVYGLANTGRTERWNWNKANIISEYRRLHPLTNFGPHDSDANIISNWHKNNPQPPRLLPIDDAANQSAIRITCARIDAAPGFAWLVQERNPSKKSGYVADPLLDWLAYTDELGHSFFVAGALKVNIMDKASPSPYDYSQRRYKGERQIALYAYWAPPAQVGQP